MTDETTRPSPKDLATAKGRADAETPSSAGDDSSTSSGAPKTDAAKEAIDRATAAVGKDEG